MAKSDSSKFRISLKMIILILTGLSLFYILGTILFFNATPKDKRVTSLIQTDYTVAEPQFIIESGVFSGRGWIHGNQIEILSKGEEIFGSMHMDIASAEKSITKETYNFWGEDVAGPMARALAEASEKGVNVHFMMDYVGSVEASTEYFEALEAAGVQYQRWRKPAWYQLARLNHRTHRKLLIVDGQTAYTGGANTADDWLPDVEDGGYKDYHFRITGPVVNDIQGAFSDNWVASQGELLVGELYYREPEQTGELKMQVSSGNPREGQMKVRKMLLHAIASAGESIRIGSAYFYPDEMFMESLIDAANRGIQIQILTPGEKIDQNYLRIASRNRWGSLLRAGIEIYEYQPSMYHAKKMIVDDHFVSIGSTNFDNRSFRLNDETNVNVLNPDFGAQMTAYYLEDLENSTRITLEDWENRPFTHRVLGWIISKLIGPYL